MNPNSRPSDAHGIGWYEGLTRRWMAKRPRRSSTPAGGSPVARELRRLENELQLRERQECDAA